MALRLGKKGVFFTFIALFIIILVVAIVTTKDTYRYREKSTAVRSRIKTMDNFIGDFESDMERAILIGGYRALISMNSYIRTIEDYVTDFDAVFYEILVNGTANDTMMDLMNQENQGAYLKSWLSRVNEESDDINVRVNIDFENVTVQQVTPWAVEILVNASVEIVDLKGLAGWTFTETYSQEISIVGFEDPMYIVETTDRVTNLINITPTLDFVDASNDTSNLNNHITSSLYVEHDGAPSFLMRFTGDFGNSSMGIESMINLDDLGAQGIPIKQRSIIDYIYWGNQSTTNYCNVTGLEDWFRIDSGHRSFYEVVGLSSPC